ncbi:MAG: response regulator transcription factor, partial [Bacteroidales bacterium]|nr:response regulator transcription factor [Bacteroidales bacterium]
YDLKLDIVGTAHSVDEGIDIINSHIPDLVLLDIQLGDELGFSVLEKTKTSINYQVLFVSAYDKYAIQAFKYSAVDYLLKPIDIEDFTKAVKKAENNIKTHNTTLNNLQVLLQNIRAPKPYLLSIPASDGLEFININEIISIKADGSYSLIRFENKKQMLISKNIGEFQEQLPSEEFCRVHNSYIVNVKQVKKIKRLGGLAAEMSEGNTIPISRSKKDAFMQQIELYLYK